MNGTKHLLAAVLGAATLATAPASAMRQTEGGAEVAVKSSLRGSTVSAGRATEVGFLAVFDKRACRRVRAKMRINQPRNGTVRVTNASGSFGAGQVRANKCAGKAIGGSRVVYTPNRGYRGADSFSINVSYPDGGSRRTATEGFRFTVC